MLSILTDPRNALTKQYTRLFELEDVKLTFEPSALRAAVHIAQKRKTGARALRSIFEKAMLDIMYEVPSMPDVVEVVISEKVITGDAKPKVISRGEKKKAG